MEEVKYQALFYGELKGGYTKEAAIAALAKVYDKDTALFESWFSNEPVVIKKEATREEVEHVRDYLADLGLVIQIEPLHNELVSNLDEVIKVPDSIDTDKLLEEAFKEIQKSFKNVQAENIAVVHLKPAPMLPRLMAYWIDIIICMVAASFIISVLLSPLGIFDVVMLQEYTDAIRAATTPEEIQKLFENDDLVHQVMKLTFLFLLFQVVYFGLMDSRFGASLGKRLFKIKVYSLVSPQVLFRQAALRQVLMVTMLFILVPLLNIIGVMILVGVFVMGAYDKNGLNQTIVDRLSATIIGMDQSNEI